MYAQDHRRISLLLVAFCYNILSSTVFEILPLLVTACDLEDSFTVDNKA